MTDVRVLLAQNMKNFREILNISQMELAEKVGCSPTLIGKIETKKRFPSADNLNRIAKALQIPPADLFMESGSSEKLKPIVSQQERKSLLKSSVLKAIDDFFNGDATVSDT